ncbi:MAG: hypothetical protein ACRC6H_08185 [Culicoidibacterales bacterium]
MSIVSLTIARLVIFSPTAQLYFLLLAAAIIIVSPRVHTSIKTIGLLDYLVKNILLLPTVAVAMVMNPITAGVLIVIAGMLRHCFFITKYFGSRNQYRDYFIMSSLLFLVFFVNLPVFVTMLVIIIGISRVIKQSQYRKIIQAGIINFVIIFLGVTYSDKNQFFEFILVGVYLILLSKTAILCQQEQFFNVKKSLAQIKINSTQKNHCLIDFDKGLIISFILSSVPVTLLIIQNRLQQLGFSSVLTILISLLEYRLYCHFLLYAIIKFIKQRKLVEQITDLLSIRYSPLFILAIVPIASIYYFYTELEPKIIIVFCILIILIIVTAIMSEKKFKRVLLMLVRD